MPYYYVKWQRKDSPDDAFPSWKAVDEHPDLASAEEQAAYLRSLAAACPAIEEGQTIEIVVSDERQQTGRWSKTYNVRTGERYWDHYY